VNFTDSSATRPTVGGVVPPVSPVPVPAPDPDPLPLPLPDPLPDPDPDADPDEPGGAVNERLTTPVERAPSTAWTRVVPAHVPSMAASQVCSTRSYGTASRVTLLVPSSNLPRVVETWMGGFAVPSTWIAIVLAPSATTEDVLAVTVMLVGATRVGLDDEHPTRSAAAMLTERGKSRVATIFR
jgi:hypothetical protein